MEDGWECQNHFATPELAESVARTLALRRDGREAYQAVGSDGQIVVTVVVTKQLRVARGSASLAGVAEAIPTHFETPMVHRVLADAKERSSAFFRKQRRKRADAQVGRARSLPPGELRL